MKNKQSKKEAITPAKQFLGYSEILAEKRERGGEEFLAPGTIVHLDPITYDDLVPDSVNSVELKIAGLKFSVEKQHPVFRNIIEIVLSIWNGTVSVTEKEHASTANRPKPFLTILDYQLARQRGVSHFTHRFNEDGQPIPENITRMILSGSWCPPVKGLGISMDKNYLYGMDAAAAAIIWAELVAMGYVMQEN